MTINEKFSGFAKLPERVALYVPGTAGPAAEDSALAERMTAEAAAKFSALFGGATITEASGAWMSDALGLIREQVKIVYSFTDADTLERNADAIIALAQKVKKDMAQEAVSVEIGGALYLI